MDADLEASDRRGESALLRLGLTPEETSRLGGSNRTRVLNFLLRWESFEALHACLDLLIPRKPTLVSLRDLRARAFLAQGRSDAALPVTRRRLQRRDSLPARALLARIYLSQGEYVRAKEIAQAMTEERDDSVMAWALLGEIELEVGDIRAARAAYSRVRELRPHGRAYMRGMFAVYRTEGDLVAASGYAVRLLETSDEERPLSVTDLRRLRDYFGDSGETPRMVEMEAELERRYAQELAELRERLSQPEMPRAVAKPTPFPPGPRAPSESLPSFEEVPVSEEEERTIAEAARRLFNFDSLLPGQLETMACALRTEDVLTILPTGGGKSLCYQLPAMLVEGKGAGDRERPTTLVISPLIALMKDQVDSLPQILRRRATTINSSLDGDELRRRMERVAEGVYRLVYAAPERLRQPPFLHALCQAGVGRLVIDEAHCVSMWGHDFRPDYLIIGEARDALGNPPVLAMTATAPTRVQRDILKRLRSPQGAGEDPRIVAGDVTRPNLQLEVFEARDNDEKLRYLLSFCKAETGSGIVYADTRVRCERLAALLRRYSVNASHYHAGIPDRSRVQDDFMSGRTRVVVATIAFGLGIDKPDIRFIVHYFPPSSMEAYYQEAGRAGRDGLPARCVLMISPYDKGLLTRRMRRGVLRVEFLREVYGAVRRRLGDRTAGRLVLADLERDLRADGTRLRVALSLLEEAELVRRGPDLPRAARVCLSAVCRQGVLPEELEAFRRAARLRPQQWLTVDLEEVAPRACISLGEIERKVLAWEEAGWLNYRPAGRDLLVELLPSPPDAAKRVETLLERYETVQIQRVNEIAAYASSSHCRHGYINTYLGGRTIERCQVCDNCVRIPPPPDPGLPDEQAQLLTILRCIRNAPWSWGRETLIRILRADDRAQHGRRPLHEKACAQAEFGALSFRSKTAVRSMLESLEQAGFLARRQLGHGGVVLDLAEAGREALENPTTLELLVP